MIGYSIPKTWKKNDLSWAMWNATRTLSGNDIYSILGDYDKLLCFGFRYVRKKCGFNVDYTRFYNQ